MIYKILYFEDRLIRLEKDRTDGYLADYKIMIAINLVYILDPEGLAVHLEYIAKINKVPPDIF